MKHYIGIDLGTTNSVIASYDGQDVRVWRSPEQNEVTPSAIYVDKRGHRYYGRRAYEMAPGSEKNAATLFKRYLGTSRRFSLDVSGVALTPEECSAEILRVLFGYLPEEIRNDPETATVITVPAAFNQMKKDATLEAAKLANIGAVALMQEPVAAVMSVMRREKREGVFLVYDLGGGTFDVSIAEYIAGRVDLLAQGGREMCGGRDWDRMIFRKVTLPWLHANFNLPGDITTDERYRSLVRLATYAGEQAKIELSSCESTGIRMDEQRLNAHDLDGREIYLEVPFDRDMLNDIIGDTVDSSVETIRETVDKAGLRMSDVKQIIFIGGPTRYRPLCDRVAAELGVPAGTRVDPMTAVAEGACVFAESIDWQSERRERKRTRESVAAPGDVQLRYEKRTAADRAKIGVIAKPGAEVSCEIASEDGGWTSGRIAVGEGAIIEVPLAKPGDNAFRIALFGADGTPIADAPGRIVITRTAATIGAIPASFPIAVKALDRLGGKPVPIYLIEENDPLPKSGSITFRSGQMLRAGSQDALVFTLWEGALKENIEDNRYIGIYRIPGTGFASGTIPTGAEIVCEYEMSESGTLHLGVSVPCIGATFENVNFYSRAEGQIDLEDTAGLIGDIMIILERSKVYANAIKDDPDVEALRVKAMKVLDTAQHSADPEEIQEAYNDLLDCRKAIAKLRKKHLKKIRQTDLNDCRNRFDKERQKLTEHEIALFENLQDLAQRSVDRNSPDFDAQLEELEQIVLGARLRDDHELENQFNLRIRRPRDFTDRAKFDRLRTEGLVDIAQRNYTALFNVLVRMDEMRVRRETGEEMLTDVNIVRE